LNDETLQGEAARGRFAEESRRLRPDLHRFCTRMTGSVSDGEDVVQEALVHALRHWAELRAETSLRAWLFRIAHNRCIDLLRRRKAFLPLDEETPMPEDDTTSLEHKQLAESALAAIFTELPPKERASVVLKDVLGCSLQETAEITASNVGAVKAAVHRGREKLERALSSPPKKPVSHSDRALIAEYVARFNAQDWPGVRALLSADARLEVVERTAGPFAERQYLQNYAALAWEWRLGLAEVEGEPTVVHFRRSASGWQPHSVIVLTTSAGKVSLVRDYVHIDYLLRGARVLEPTD
jgi:RNA polymerase sigma-70 factor (ECF subfamily)